MENATEVMRKIKRELIRRRGLKSERLEYMVGKILPAILERSAVNYNPADLCDEAVVLADLMLRLIDDKVEKDIPIPE